MPTDNPYDALLAPAAPNLYADLIQGEEDSRRQQLAGALQTSVATKPDTYATQKRVAGYLGYPVAAVEAQPEEMQRQAQVRQVQADTANAPVLQRKFSDADFAKLAHDDSGVLSSLKVMAGALGKGAKYIVGADPRNAMLGDLHAGVEDFARGTAGVFRAAAELPAPLLDPLEQFPSIGGNPLRRLAEGFGMLGDQAGRQAQAAASKGDGGLLDRGVSSGVRSLVTSLLAIPTALLRPAAGMAVAPAVPGGPSFMETRR